MLYASHNAPHYALDLVEDAYQWVKGRKYTTEFTVGSLFLCLLRHTMRLINYILVFEAYGISKARNVITY